MAWLQHDREGECYNLHVDLLMQLEESRPARGYAAKALESSERAHGRGLLETLTEARADIRQGVDPDLLERERLQKRRLNDRAADLARASSGRQPEAQLAAARHELERAVSDYRQAVAQIRQRSSRYATLTQPRPLTVTEIQERVLDPDTLLLEYSLGEERSFLWAVTHNSAASFVLAGRAEIEGCARRVYDSMTARNRTIAGETAERRRARVTQADAECRKAAARLSAMLLGPVSDRLERKRLLIVGDGALHYIPFGALPAPGSRGSEAPLVVEHEIVTAASASTLALLRTEVEDRPTAAKAIAILADPVFRAGDPRVKLQAPARRRDRTDRAGGNGCCEPKPTSDAERAARGAGQGGFMRLRFSRQEAELIASLAPAASVLTALDFAASRSTAQSAELGRYRIVHFATHAVLDSKYPELSGLVLSLVDSEGRAQDGFLRLHDVYDMKLGADLVVLSACQTALGKENGGEGLIGLTRGFMCAGAPRVVASLWRVDDRATAELMKRFYRGMLKDGLRPGAALRAAQASMCREKRWEAPHYWAGFGLQGEWR